MQAKRKVAVGNGRERRAASASIDEAWIPQHPMHVELADRLAALPEPHIEPYHPAVRLTIALGAAATCWLLTIAAVYQLSALAG